MVLNMNQQDASKQEQANIEMIDDQLRVHGCECKKHGPFCFETAIVPEDYCDKCQKHN